MKAYCLSFIVLRVFEWKGMERELFSGLEKSLFAIFPHINKNSKTKNLVFKITRSEFYERFSTYFGLVYQKHFIFSRIFQA